MSGVSIIAEGGVNHNGSLELALKLCDAATEAGADFIKFQTFRTEHNVLEFCEFVDYQKKGAEGHKSHFDMLKALELSDADFRVLKNYCREINIGFLSTPSDVPSLELLCRLELKILKISSGDIINIPLLRKAGSLGKNIILSTGMSTLAEVQKAVDELITAGTPKEKITLLHCHSAYPTRFEDANLSVMRTLRETFGTKVGLSDHTEGAELSIAAVALGASVIEKHLTLDRNMEGPDQKMSTEPGPFAEIVKAVRNTEKAMGDGIKRITEAEAEIRKVYGKGIVALKPVVTGEIFSENNVTVKRPCHGLSVRDWDKVLGRKASRNFKKDEFITL